jgi:serine/threonine-protein phosphatase 6 regulatory ankyrin repeat subunit B
MAKFRDFLAKNPLGIEDQDDNGMTALLWAATKGNLEMVQLLVERGADITHKNAHGWTVLMVSSLKAHPHVVRYLLELTLPSEDGKGSEPALDVNDTNTEGKTALMCAAGYTPPKSAAAAATEDTTAAAEDDVKDVEESNDNILDDEWALVDGKRDDLETMQLLIDHKADMNRTSFDFHHHALMWCSAVGNVKGVELLLRNGAELQHEQKDGMTSLHMACHRSHPKVVQKLLEHKANVNSTDTDGWTPLVWACRYEPDAGGHVLHEHAQADEARRRRQSSNAVQTIDLLVRNHALIDQFCPEGTALMHAIDHKDADVECVKKLLLLGASLEVTKDGKTASQITSNIIDTNKFNSSLKNFQEIVTLLEDTERAREAANEFCSGCSVM